MKYLILAFFIVVVALTSFSAEAADRVSKPGEGLTAAKDADSERATPTTSALPADKPSAVKQSLI